MKLSLLVSICLNVATISRSDGSFPYSNLQRSTMNSRASSIDSLPSLFRSYFANAASTFCWTKSVSLILILGLFCDKFWRILVSWDLSFSIDFFSSARPASSPSSVFFSASKCGSLLGFYLNCSTLVWNAWALRSCISILILSYFAIPIHSPLLPWSAPRLAACCISRAFSNWTTKVPTDFFANACNSSSCILLSWLASISRKVASMNSSVSGARMRYSAKN